MATSTEILDRLRLRMPLALTLTDPISGKEFTTQRDNMLALLAVDFANIVLELQTVAVLYGEMGRIAAAAKYAKDQADMRLRQWKVRVTKAAEAQAGKALAEHAKQDAYRSHAEYESMYRPVHEAEMLLGLSSDLKTAFEIKGRALDRLAQIDFGHTRNEAGADRLAEMAKSLEAEALPKMREAAAEVEALKGKKKRRELPPQPQEDP
jgi:hypothetical protein